MQSQFRPDHGTQSGIIGFLIRVGLARDEKSARLVLGVVFVIVLAVVGYLVFSGEESPRSEPYTPDTEYGGRELPDNQQ